MNEQELRERLTYFQTVTARYGSGVVPAATVYQAFEELIQPSSIEFVPIRMGFYGRALNNDLVHLIKLQALKGGSYSVCWGVSLSYIPHQTRSGLRWHRGFMSSRFDLFESLWKFQRHWLEVERDMAHTLNGPVYFLETLQTMWSRLSGQVSAWFASMQSLEDVLSKANDYMLVKGRGYELHDPPAAIVYAFTLARLGRREEASTALETHLCVHQTSPDAQALLRKALQNTSQRP